MRVGRISRHPVVSLALVVLTALAVPGHAQVIEGRVIDATSRAGVPRAVVVMTEAEGGRVLRRATTAPDGFFTIGVAGGGEVRLRVSRVGYGETATRPMTLPPDDTLDVTVRISAVAMTLDPLAVSARARRLDVRGVFRDRPWMPADSFPPTTAKGERRGIYVEGMMATPTPCYQLAGAADREGQVITLTVEARAKEPDCGETPGTFTYRVNVRGLPPGAYTFRVLHAYRAGEWDRAWALDKPVTVR